MTKPVLEHQRSLEVEDYMDRFDSDEDKLNTSSGNNLNLLKENEINLVKLRQQKENSTDLSNIKAPTMVFESVHVGRPLKTLSLITNFAVIIFFFLSTSGSNWILTTNFRVGLWEECIQDFNTSTKIVCNRNPCYKNYVHVFVVSCVLALITSVVSTVLLAYAMKSKYARRKRIIYNIIIVMHLIEVILFLISLIGYPISFIKDSTLIQRIHIHGELWGIGWSYVMGWLGVISVGVSTGLLHFDKDSEELVFYEKISRNSCPEYA